MANDTIIRGSDIDIKIQLSYLGQPVTSGVSFEISYFDSYNHGKIWKYDVPESGITKEGTTWIVRFPADKQKFNGYHNVRCIVDTPDAGIQQVVFKRAFYLNDPILPNAEVVELSSVVEASIAALTGSLVIFSLVQSVSYNQQTMVITVVFTNGTTVNIDAHDVFPFRLVSSDWDPQTAEDNIFYYTYEGEEPTPELPTITIVSGDNYQINFNAQWATVTQLNTDENYQIHILRGGVSHLDGQGTDEYTAILTEINN